MNSCATRDPWGVPLLAVAAVLLLTHLDNGRLWQDEAETAVLARNTLRYGYPSAFDGVNRVNPALSIQKGNAWTYHSWLPMYLAAVSFALLGPTTFAARLPFALLGLGSLWLAYRVFKRITADRLVSRIASLTLVVSVPFLLHMRQCRYYAAAAFFTLWTVSAYWRFIHRKRWSALELLAALTLLFHADHGAFIPVCGGLALHFVGSQPTRKFWRSAAAVALIIAATTIPWMVYLQSWQHHEPIRWKELSHHLQFYFRQINRFLVPLVFWLIMAGCRRRSLKHAFGELGSETRNGWRLTGCLLAAGVLFLIFIPWQRHFRYLVFLIPWLFLGQAALLADLFRSHQAVATALTTVLLFTDLIHYSGPSILAARIPGIRSKLSSPNVKCRSLPLEFLGELTHRYRGPVDGIVELLQREGKPGQSVKIPYDEISLMFYTPSLKMEPVLKKNDFNQPTFPDWIVLRRDWLPDEFFSSPYYRKLESNYRRVVLDAPDIPWQNRPDPGYHRFRTDREAPPVIILQKIR